MRFYKIILFSFLTLLNQQIQALGTKDLLPAEQAFKISAKALSAEQIEVSWEIAEGYYLYRSKTAINSQTDSIQLEKTTMPAGIKKHDEFFGEMEIYRNQLKTLTFFQNPDSQPELKILVKYQGCADIGVCYPPQKKIFTLLLPQVKNQSTGNSVTQILNNFTGIKLNLFEDELLPAEQAFQFFASVKDDKSLKVNWEIADGYYLYRDKIKLKLDPDTPSVSLDHFNIPQGEPYHDEAFGQVQIFYKEVGFDVPLIRSDTSPQAITLTAKFQGCADRGVCYPPMESKIKLQLPAALASNLSKQPESNSSALSEQDQIFQSLKSDSFGLTILSFFGFGLLLAFTPCIFPMIPILSGIIVGQGDSVTTRKAFLLSLSYVFASALTYTLFGILAALFGSNLQSTFQEPWIIALFSGIFILLSLSMFGFYNLELPTSIRSRLHNSSDSHRDGSYLGAAIMGALSSLIVGPCVAAPLAGALIYIGQTGDVLLGAVALFVMGFAMGSPLLLLGASAGKLLPKAGHWLNSTKAIFGVIMLAVSVWMLDRILPASITMLLSSALLIIPAIYLKALDSLPEITSNWQRLWKGLGLMMLIYGVLLLIGLSMGNSNPLLPLKGLTTNASAEQHHGLAFHKISSSEELDQILKNAQANQQKVMLDFYADWCISCKEMEAYTFTNEQVQQKLSRFILVQADVTKNTDQDKALLQRFNLIGPPAILFFDTNKQEQKSSRVIGYQDSEQFLSILNML